MTTSTAEKPARPEERAAAATAVMAEAAPATTAATGSKPPAAATSARVPDNGAYSYRHFVGGAVGGMVAALITSPLEVVKTRLQIRGGR